jgi:NitT/TauT family transport system substrate-binding protein
MRLDPAGFPLPIRSGRARASRYLLVAASGLAVVVAAAGCGGSSGPGGEVSQTVTIAALANVNDAPIFLAQKEGLFAAEGLSHVVIKSYTSPAAELAAVQSAHADIAASDYGDIFAAETQSPDLKIVADGYDATQGSLEILTLPGSSIKAPAELANPNNRNVKVALPDDDVLRGLLNSGRPVSLEAAAATEVLSNYVANAALNVDWVPMPEAQEVAALENHQVQAILVGEPYVYQAESEAGAVELLDACSGATANLPLSGYVATAAWAGQNSAAVADFRAALSKAQSEAAMTGQIQKVLPASTGMTVEAADMITVATYPTSTNANALATTFNLMSGYHMFDSGKTPFLTHMLLPGDG